MADDAVADGTTRRDRLAQRRKAVGLTQRALARLLGVERSTVVRWERGETEPLPWLRPKLAKALQVTAERLDELMADGDSADRDMAVPAAPRQLPATATGFTGGFDPSGVPASSQEAIRGFPDALGVPADKIPPYPDAQAGMYRTLVADRTLLIVLDNARDEQQVRPLLPASPSSLVVVTSRNQPTGLASTEGARLVTLDVLTQAEAIELLTTRVGAARASAEPDAVGEIAALCARLPLALAVAAARAAARPALPLAALATELGDSTGRLDALDADDQARRLLKELTRAHLITEHAPGRYAFHDLHTAHAAATVMYPWRVPIPLAPLSPGAAAEASADDRQAMAWFEAEQAVLSAAVARAAASGFDRHAWQLPWAMADYLQRRGHWHEWVFIVDTGLAAATRLGDEAGQAVSHLLLGHAHQRIGDRELAGAHLRRSMDLYRQLGDRRGEAKGHIGLSEIASGTGRYVDALDHCERALHLFRAVGDTAGEAEMLNNIGWYHGLLGDYEQARAFCQRSLALTTELGYRFHEGNAWDSLGYAEHHLGNLGEAAACYQRALSIFREFGDRYNEAATLNNL